MAITPASQAVEGYELELIEDSNDTVLAPRAMENQAHYFDGNLYFDAYGDKGYGVYFTDPEGNTNFLEPPLNFALQDIPMITSFGNQLLVAYHDKRASKRAGVWIYENGEWEGSLEQPMDAYYPADLDIALDDRFVKTPEGVFFFARDIDDQVRLVRYDGSFNPAFSFDEGFLGSLSSTQSYLTISYEPASASANRNARIWTTLRSEASGVSPASSGTSHQDAIMWFDAEVEYPFDFNSEFDVLGGVVQDRTEFVQILDHQVVGETFVYVVEQLPGGPPAKSGLVLATDKSNVDSSPQDFATIGDDSFPLAWTNGGNDFLFTDKPLESVNTKLVVVGEYENTYQDVPNTFVDVVVLYDDAVAAREAGPNPLGTDSFRILAQGSGDEDLGGLIAKGNFTATSELSYFEESAPDPAGVIFNIGFETLDSKDYMGLFIVVDPDPENCLDAGPDSDACLGAVQAIASEAEYSNASQAKLVSVFDEAAPVFEVYFSSKTSVDGQDDQLRKIDLISTDSDTNQETFMVRAGTTGDSIAQYIGSDNEGVFVSAVDGVSLTVGRLGGEEYFVDNSSVNFSESTSDVTPWADGYLLNRTEFIEGWLTTQSLYVDQGGVTELDGYFDSIAIFDDKLWIAGQSGGVPKILTESGQVQSVTDLYSQSEFSGMETNYVFANDDALFINHGTSQLGYFLTKFDGSNLVSSQQGFAADKLLTVGSNTFVTATDGSGDPESLFQLNEDMSFSKVPFPDAEGKYQNVTHMFEHLGQLCVVADIGDSFFGGSGQNVYCLQNGQMQPQMAESLDPDFQVQQVVSAGGEIFFGALRFGEGTSFGEFASTTLYEIFALGFIGVIENQSVNFLQFDGKLHSPYIAADDGLILQVHDPITGLETYRLKKILENPSASFSAPVGFSGPVITTQEVVGDQLVLSGTNLSQVKSVALGEVELEFEFSNNKLSASLQGLSAGVYPARVSGSFGSVQLEEVEISKLINLSENPELWTKQISPTEIKLYAKNIVGAGKVQFFHNGNEVAWVRAEDDTDPKLRVISSGPMTGANYLVRTREMVEGKNVFEIFVDGERVLRRAQGN